MKRILFLVTILSLFAYGCNRDEQSADRGTGMQEEEQLGTDSQAYPQDEEVSPDSNIEEVDPTMQEEQTRPESMEESDPAMDSDQSMQEEEMRGEEPGTFDTTDERDSSMGSGTDTAPEAEPTDATGVQQ